jgi:hypothetical protein
LAGKKRFITYQSGQWYRGEAEIGELITAPDGNIWALTYTNDIAWWTYEVKE